MADKKVVAGVAGVAVVGILSYFGYRVMKQINDIDFDFVGENIDDYYNTSTSESSSQGYAERKES